MSALGFAAGPVVLPVWAIGVAGAAIILLGALALRRPGPDGVASAILRSAVVAIVAVGAWLLLERVDLRDRAAERRALDQRNVELTAHALAPGSPLGCLDALAGDAVDSACEKVLFSSPEIVAAAVAYVQARLDQLTDGVALMGRGETGYDKTLSSLRLALEADRYGIVAHIFSVRDNCTPLQCDGLSLLKDRSRVQANLKDRVFEAYVARYAADWSARGHKAPVAESSAGASAVTAAVPAAPLNPKYDFPSASSIPPVSIMTSEAPAAAPPVPKPAPAARRQAAAPGTPPAAQAPAPAPR